MMVVRLKVRLVIRMIVVLEGIGRLNMIGNRILVSVLMVVISIVS